MEEGAATTDVCLNDETMENEKVKQIFSKLIDEATELQEPEKYNQYFMDWRANAIRMTSEIFEKGSLQTQSLETTRFVGPNSYSSGPFSDLAKKQHVNTINRFNKMLLSFMSEHELFADQKHEIANPSHTGEKKVFISHSSEDDEIGKEVINLLQLVGIKHSQIFYTSAAGYGTPLGKDWIETLKKEVSSEGIVLSLLSENYFKSQICLLEMGATWVLTKFKIPILIPPMVFKSVNELISTTQGFDVTNGVMWSSLKKMLEKRFELAPLPEDKWEPQRDAILDRIQTHLPTDKSCMNTP